MLGEFMNRGWLSSDTSCYLGSPVCLYYPTCGGQATSLLPQAPKRPLIASITINQPTET